MKRAVLAALCGAVLIATPVAVGYAQPGTPDCVQAETALAASVTTRDAAVAAQAELAVEDDLGATDLEVARLEAAIAADPTREAELRPRIDAIKAVIAAETAVANAAAARDAACAEPAVVTPTPTPTTAPTLAPDSDDNGDFDQIGPGAVPSGGVATGG